MSTETHTGKPCNCNTHVLLLLSRHWRSRRSDGHQSRCCHLAFIWSALCGRHASMPLAACTCSHEPGQALQLTAPDSLRASEGWATQEAAVTFSDSAVRKSSMRTQVNTDLPWIMTCVCWTWQHHTLGSGTCSADGNAWQSEPPRLWSMLTAREPNASTVIRACHWYCRLRRRLHCEE